MKQILLLLLVALSIKTTAQQIPIDLTITNGIYPDTVGYNNSSINLKIQDMLFKKDFEINNSVFPQQANIDSTVFTSLKFLAGQFKNGVDIEHTIFKEPVSFRNAWSFSTFIFCKNRAYKSVDFSSDYSANETYFLSNSIFNGSIFPNVTFQGAWFVGAASFRYCQFGDANFQYARILNTIDFTNATFKTLDLSRLITTDKTVFDFTNAVLPDYIDFSYNWNIINKVDFTKANFTGRTKPIVINILNTDLDSSKVILDEHFKVVRQ